MPARTRDIGPEVSQEVAAVMLTERRRRDWDRPRLSAEMALRGYAMSVATIRNIERGVIEKGRTRIRIVSVDEAQALGQTLGISGLLTSIIFREA
jgi:ribosome-binding protein aMBF1 (putative translation factor)